MKETCDHGAIWQHISLPWRKFGFKSQWSLSWARNRFDRELKDSLQAGNAISPVTMGGNRELATALNRSTPRGSGPFQVGGIRDLTSGTSAPRTQEPPLDNLGTWEVLEVTPGWHTGDGCPHHTNLSL